MALKMWHIAPVVVFVWAVGGAAVWWGSSDPSSRGQFGDMFGAVNAFFTGMAFAGLLVTLAAQQDQLELQRSELALQREELKLQREEMKGSRAELAHQVAAQRAMVRATTAQIAVAAAQARIEALKVRAGSGIGNRTDSTMADIDMWGDRLGDLSNAVESECNSLMQSKDEA